MSAADGVGPIAQNVGEKLGSLEGKYQMIVVCGKNEKVQKALKSREWPANVKVVVNGFVSNMDDWMVAADLMVNQHHHLLLRAKSHTHGGKEPYYCV